MVDGHADMDGRADIDATASALVVSDVVVDVGGVVVVVVIMEGEADMVGVMVGGSGCDVIDDDG